MSFEHDVDDEDDTSMIATFKVFLAAKPAPTYESKFANRHAYQLGSLSHYINARAAGYHDLPDFPEVPPDPTARHVEPPPKPAENPWNKEDRHKVIIN